MTVNPNPDNTFGSVEAVDLDFGNPALDMDTEAVFSTTGFTEHAATEEDDRITPSHLLVTQQPLDTTPDLPPHTPTASPHPTQVVVLQPTPAPFITRLLGSELAQIIGVGLIFIILAAIGAFASLA